MYEIALEYQQLGFSVVPFDVVTNKTPVKWRDEFEKVEGWENHFKSINGIGIICGADSGHLGVIDVDQKHDATATLSKRFLECLKFNLILQDINFYIEETRSGGLHVYFRRKDTTDAKLFPAKTIEENGKEAALIEVLGEGQLVFAYPSRGYRMMEGSMEEVPLITEDQYIELILMCKTFNELPEKDYETYEPKDVDPDDQRVGSIYNREVDSIKFVSWLCDKHDWKVYKKVGSKYWLTRPGKDQGVSATFNHDGRKLLVIFSSSVKYLDTHRGNARIGHTPFAVYAKLDHGGNYSAATGALISEGFVSKDDWPEIERIDRQVPKSIDFDDILPDGFFRNFMDEVSEAFQVPHELVLMEAMAAISTCVSNAYKIRLMPGWTEVPCLWVMGIAPPSERKSPIVTELIRPIQKWFRRKRDELQPKMALRDARRSAIEKALLKANKVYEKALETNDEDLSECEKNIEMLSIKLEQYRDEIKVPNLIQSDITPEGLVVQMEANGDVCGILSAENEPIDIALGHYSDKPNLSIYLKGYSGDEYTQTRKHSESIYIEEAKLSMAVLVQPSCCTKLMQNVQAVDRGLVARFLYIYPESIIGYRKMLPKAISERGAEMWNDFLVDILELPHYRFPMIKEEQLVRNDEYCKAIPLSPEAHEIFLVHREKNELDMRKGGPLDETYGWGGKLMGNIGRICLILHLIQGGRDEPIDAKTMKLACNWIEHLTDHFFFALGYPSDNPLDRRVLRVIKSLSKSDNNSEKTLRDLFQIVRTRKHPRMSDWDEVFLRMQNLGYLKIIDEKTAGRSKKVVNFHPKLFQIYA